MIIVRRHFAWFASLLFAACAAQTQAPVTPPRKTLTVETLDQAIEVMRRVPREMPAVLGNPPPDESGRRIDDDLADYFLTAPVLARLKTLRDEAAASTAPRAQIPSEKMGPLNLLQESQACRLAVIGSYWQRRQTQDYHDDMILRLVARLPEAEQLAARSELRAIDARGNASRAQVEAGVRSCDVVDQAAALANAPELTGIDLRETAYNALRVKLAAQIPAAKGYPAQELLQAQRSAPCPAPARPASGTHGPKIRFFPGLRDYYPPEAISMEISGSGKLRLSYDDTGCVISAAIMESTGSKLLDGAALRFALDYQFIPQSFASVARAGFVLLPVNFGISGTPSTPPRSGPATQIQP